MSSKSLRIALLALPLAAACASGGSSYRLTGGVRGSQAGLRDATGLAPVSGAVFALQCPDTSKNRELGRTDDAGRIATYGDGSVPLDCKVNVTDQGFRPVTYAVRDICATQGSGECRELDVRAVLQPQTGSAGDTNGSTAPKAK